MKSSTFRFLESYDQLEEIKDSGKMIVTVCGTYKCPERLLQLNFKRVVSKFEDLYECKIGAFVVYEGGNVESYALKYATNEGMPVFTVKTHWGKLTKEQAVYARTSEMVSVSDAAIVFWDFKSKESKLITSFFRKSNKPILTCGISESPDQDSISDLDLIDLDRY